MAIFDDLINSASQFVEKQKGDWDQSKWEGFLLDIEKKNIKLTDEMEENIGLVLESIKKFYINSTDTGKKMIGNISDQAAQFVGKTKGTWDHLGWEDFVKDIRQGGIDLTEGGKSYLGGILESAKRLYSSLPLIAKEDKREIEVVEAKEEHKVTAAKAREKVKTPEVSKKKTPKKTTPKVKKKAVVKEPKKVEEPSVKKEEKKVEAKEVGKVEKTKTTKTVKTAPKKKGIKETIVKKPMAKKTIPKRKK